MKRVIKFATGDVLPNNGSGYFPADIRHLYNIPSHLDGTGQTIGILEFSNGYSMVDANGFWSLHGIQPPNVEFVSVDGTQNDRGVNPDDEEASLDLQWAGAIAPKATIIVYEANAGNTFPSFGQAMIATLTYILRDAAHHPTVLSISYGDAEENLGKQDMQQISDLILQLSAKGVTVCISSGDQGAYGMHDPNGPQVPHADGPATAPFAVAVGGTSLQPNGTESAWTYNGPDNGGATGGGFSRYFSRPAYQNGITSDVARGIPDVSLNADPATGYQIIFQGQPAVVGGTSVSCPVFAAIVALANQQRAAHQLPPLQNLPSVLYDKNATGFRDITTGNNAFNGVAGYQATVGWDACTGLGSVDATALIEFLSSQNTGTTSTTPPPSTHGHAPVVHLQAVIKSVEPDAVIHGVSHHHILIDRIIVVTAVGTDPKTIGPEVFCAIRYGDDLGLPGPIPGLTAGQPIELQGEYIDKNHAYPSIGNPGDPVIHYTHHPVGFIVYQGQRYE